MKFSGFCKALNKDVHEGVCIEIIAELYGGKKEEIIKEIRRSKIWMLYLLKKFAFLAQIARVKITALQLFCTLMKQ
jgi:hypothetical protein